MPLRKYAPTEADLQGLIHVEYMQLKGEPDYSRILINFAKKFKFHTTEIAAATGKRHDNVLRDFVQLCEILEFDPTQFIEPYVFHNNRGNRVQANGYSLPVELYVTLVTGYSVTTRAECIRLWEKKEKAYFARIPREDAMNLIRELGFPLFIYPVPTDGKYRVNWEASFDLSKLLLATTPYARSMTSLEIAAEVGTITDDKIVKQHKHVLRDIDKQFADLKEDPTPFQGMVPYLVNNDAQRERRVYNLPRDHVLILITGYLAKERYAVVCRLIQLMRTPEGTDEAIIRLIEKQAYDQGLETSLW
jgi:phage regulator Rha-like protein